MEMPNYCPNSLEMAMRLILTLSIPNYFQIDQKEILSSSSSEYNPAQFEINTSIHKSHADQFCWRTNWSSSCWWWWRYLDFSLWTRGTWHHVFTLVAGSGFEPLTSGLWVMLPNPRCLCSECCKHLHLPHTCSGGGSQWVQVSAKPTNSRSGMTTTNW